MTKDKLNIKEPNKKKNGLFNEIFKRTESPSQIRLKSVKRKGEDREPVRRSRSQNAMKKMAEPPVIDERDEALAQQESVYEEIPFDIVADEDRISSIYSIKDIYDL